MLADAVAGATAEANLIGLALSSGVPAKLNDAARDPARSGSAVTETAEHLQRTSSVQRTDALWAVTAIAEALGVSSVEATDRGHAGPGAPQQVAARPPSPAQGGPNDVLIRVGGQEHVAAPGSVVTIGRDPGSTIALDSAAVSRQHARVQLGSSGWEFVDLDSTQGSFVNGLRVRTHALQGETDRDPGSGADAVQVRLSPSGPRRYGVAPPCRRFGHWPRSSHRGATASWRSAGESAVRSHRDGRRRRARPHRDPRKRHQVGARSGPVSPSAGRPTTDWSQAVPPCLAITSRSRAPAGAGGCGTSGPRLGPGSMGAGSARSLSPVAAGVRHR